MTTPALLPGNRFRAYRSAGGQPETFTYLCIGTSITLTITNTFEDVTAPDCDTPLAIPTRKSILSSTSWGGRVAGQVDAKRFAQLRADAASQTPVRYQFMMDQTLANGGGTWTGGVFIESLEVTKQGAGIVSFTAQFRGDDALVWLDAVA